MRWLLVLWLCLVAWDANAQPVGVFTQGGTSAPPGYSGPGDQGVTLLHCWGTVRCSVTYTTNKLLHVCIMPAHTTCGDIGYDANGNIDAAALTTLGCSGDGSSTSGCAFDKLYDSSGSATPCDLTSATTTDWGGVTMTTTANGHVQLISSNSSNVFYHLICTASDAPFGSSSNTDVSLMMLLTNVSSNQFAVPFGLDDDTTGATANSVFPIFITSTAVLADWEDASTQHQSNGGTGTAIGSTLACWANQIQANATTGLSQAIINGTADSQTVTTGTFVSPSKIQTNMLVPLGPTTSFNGYLNFLALASTHVTNGNTTTVLHNAALNHLAASPPC